MVINVLSVSNSEKLGRKELLAWINNFSGIENPKIEDLSNAISFCIALTIVFKECQSPKKVRHDVKFEYEYIQNWKLVQAALVELGVDRDVHVQRLSKSSFIDNLEFLQWFHKFIKANLEHRGIPEHDIHQHNGSPLKGVNISNAHVNSKHETAPLDKENTAILEQNLVIACRERDYYFHKLQEIEEILRDEESKETPLGKNIIRILYAEERV